MLRVPSHTRSSLENGAIVQERGIVWGREITGPGMVRA